MIGVTFTLVSTTTLQLGGWFKMVTQVRKVVHNVVIHMICYKHMIPKKPIYSPNTSTIYDCFSKLFNSIFYASACPEFNVATDATRRGEQSRELTPFTPIPHSTEATVLL